MLAKFFRFFAAALATFALLSGCAVYQPISTFPTGILYRMSPGYIATIEGRAGSNDVIGLKVRVPLYCAGKIINLSAEYRTSAIYGGTSTFHGIHFDYELVASGHDPWPHDWQAAPSPEWRPITRQWFMPANMAAAWIRVGFQGVSGTMHLRNLVISC